MKIFFWLVAFLPFQAWASQTPASFHLKAEGIPSGLVLVFPVPKEMSESVDTFRVFRSSRAVDPEEDPVFAQIAELNYYHEWYKDYFVASEVGKTFYYQVRAYDSQKRLLAVSDPHWVSWKVMIPPVSGMVMTPTAYRRVPMYESPYSPAARLFPINVDLNAMYYIGRLYSHNELTELTNTRNSLFSRIGVWFLQMDAKMILEREGRHFPQIAVGGEGSAMIRDAAQPSFQDPSIPAFQVKKENSRNFTSAFVAASKEIGWFRSTVGWTSGSSASKVVYLTEFLAKESVSDSGIFYNLQFRPGKRFSFQAEFIRPLGAKANPYLINLQIGRALHTNFDLAYLRYDRGYEVMGHINFRLTLYPASGRGK